MSEYVVPQTMRPKRPRAVGAVLGPAFGLLCLAAMGLPAATAQPFACTEGGRPLRLGFYAHFEPVSHSADRTAGSTGFDAHRGYEADLLSAPEAIEGAKLSFSRRGIGTWNVCGAGAPPSCGPGDVGVRVWNETKEISHWSPQQRFSPMPVLKCCRRVAAFAVAGRRR